MLSKNTKNNKGFSLVEMLVVIGISAICFAGATLSFNTQKTKALLDNGQASVFNALQKAQNQSQSGVGDSNHNYGVHIEPNKVVIFEDSYIPGSGDEIDLLSPLSTDQNNLDIVFKRISGATLCGGVPCGDKIIKVRHAAGLPDEEVKISGSGVISAP
jgi:prepilin-type N-terminal cleavage/methylation domain-containing protein